MTKRKSKATPKQTKPSASTPRKGEKSKQRRVQPDESPSPNDSPEVLKQKKLEFATMTATITPTSHVLLSESEPPKLSTLPASPPVSPSNISAPSPTSDTNRDTFSPQKSPNECRYKITMVMPPIKDPTELLPTFCKGFRNIFDTIQNICKPNPIWIGPWDPKQASNHIPIIKTKKDIPDGKFPMHRQKLSAYLGGYFDPNPKGETMYSKIRFITPSESSLDLALLGLHLRGAFYYMEPEWQVAIPQNPIPCQAIRSTCIGWLFGSTKFINEKSFLPAVKKALDLPPECHIGMQWRVINTPTGKRPPYDTTKSSPCAIHIDVDDLYAPIVATRASE